MSDREKVNILIVDDRAENILVLENLLDGPDRKIVKATSGNEALEKLIDHDFALVILDVQMPDMDGFEVATHMRKSEKARNVPIVFVTALSKEQKFIFKGYEVGAVDYLFKPIEPSILTSKVNVFLDLHRQKRMLEEQARELKVKVDELSEARKQLEKVNKVLEDLSSQDGLTGLLNRRRFEEIADSEWRRAMRLKTTVALIMADIDCFKSYNDRYGHLAGDTCLKKVAMVMSENLRRAGDHLARFGGEEFVIILSNIDKEGALAVAERIRESIEELGIPHEDSPVSDHVTVSLGVASVVPHHGSSYSLLINSADKAMYSAKQAGRNRTVYSGVEVTN